MANEKFGSLTKEPPLATLDATIQAASPGMTYASLLAFARENKNAHRDAPGLISKRFLLLNNDNRVAYDHFLALTKIHSVDSALLRKVMYFVWAYRDERIRRFVCERIAAPSGLWRTSEIINKKNAEFFRTWLGAKAAKKARSNFEFFLSEAGIYSKSEKAVHLELDDGWLEQASIAAAQHEDDPTVRDELLANPIEFLRKRHWLGLINAEDPKPLFFAPAISQDAKPNEDDALKEAAESQNEPRNWDRPAPNISATAQSATFNINVVARERANSSHYNIEKILATTAKKNGYTPKYNQSIDLFFDIADETVLVEIKSCTDSNFHTQTRRGISQLFEYRFLHNRLFKPKHRMLLLMETKPPRGKEWLVDYANSLDVILAWKKSDVDLIETTSTIPASLTKIITE